MDILTRTNEYATELELMLQTHHVPGALYYFERQRLNQLLTDAVNHPLVMVCAGVGYGKTSSVHDFTEGYEASTAWLQLSERDNVGPRFWENLIRTMAQVSMPYANAISKLGFPDTTDKLNQFSAIVRKNFSPLEKRILVLDDFHIIENPLVLRFAECNCQNLTTGTTLILISRSTPRLNIAGMISKGLVFNISENDLRFTENELSQYFHKLNISPPLESQREIMQDTGGWAFAINLIARSYQKAPGYEGYLRGAMKTNIFQVMETEIWDEISERVQRFLVRVSLIDHLSYELIELLALGDKDLIIEMERQNAYIRRDSYINAYLIHPLFLEFLKSKQEILSREQIYQTYKIAGEWCNKNGFNIDALSYSEKIGDYEAIVSILNALPVQLPYDVAKYAAVICDRAPAEVFDTVAYLAVSYVRCYMRIGLWQRANELAEYYEAKFLSLPEDNVFRKCNLCGLYLAWAYLRNFMCLSDNTYDFDLYFEKFRQYFDPNNAPKIYSVQNRIVGPWISSVSSSKKGAPEEYIKTVSRASAAMPACLGGFMTGEEDIARGELKFFQGELSAAEAFITQGLRKAREQRQFEIQHRALLYTLRISIAQGSYPKAEQALKEMKAQLDDVDYCNRYVNHDISIAWYYYVMDLPEKIPDWIKQDIAPYRHASSIENFENQMKARYCYATRNYPPLLAYVQEMRQKDSYLYGRVVMFTLEACSHYKMKDKKKAFATLLEAYETAAPNGLIMPFIELGKDMRTLTSSAMKEPNFGIPKAWLENLNRKAASYAKRQALVVEAYKQANRITNSIILSPRETEILRDLSHGLSRSEISVTRNLSINTVKMVINNIYNKLGAENIADLIRIAVERKLI